MKKHMNRIHDHPKESDNKETARFAPAQRVQIAPRVRVRFVDQPHEVPFGHSDRLAAQDVVQQRAPGRGVRQRDVDALHQSPPHGLVQLLGPIGGTCREETRGVLSLKSC